MNSETVSQSSNSIVAFNKTKNLFIVQTKEDLQQIEKDLIIIDKVTSNHYALTFLDKERYRCPYNCGKLFKERGNLRIHIRLHTGERPFKCTFDNCNKAFLSKGKLNIHMNQHLGIKPYVCTFPGCNKKYSGISRLKIHLRTHTGEKPYKCPFPNCGRSFNEKGNLKTHIRIHTGEKPYECTYEGCHKRFKAKGHLNDHMKIHSKIKAFECKICGGKYTRSSTLKIHSYTHLNIKPYKCPYKDCERQFTEKGNMHIHMKTHLKEKVQTNESSVCHNYIPFPNATVSNTMVSNINIMNYYCPLYTPYMGSVYYISTQESNIQEKGVNNNIIFLTNPLALAKGNMYYNNSNCYNDFLYN